MGSADDGSALEDVIRTVVRSIPRGRVATYGQVAALAGAPGAARRVGRVLRETPASTRIPWHRVLSWPGRIAPALLHEPAGSEQARRLRAERVLVDARGRVDLERFGWNGEPAGATC